MDHMIKEKFIVTDGEKVTDESEEAFMEHNIHPQQPSTKKGRYFQCRHKTLCAWRKWPRSWASPSPTPTR